jgi:3-deoxy-D-manno-octulosonic-acid transferase
LFGNKAEILFFPYDTSFSMRRFLNDLQPRLIGCAETEIWPNLVRQSSKAEIPIVLFNGRMSERAFARYRKIKRSMALLLGKYDHFFFRTDSDADRYLALAGNDKKLPHVVCGDMKFDAPMTKMTAGSILATRERLNVMPEDFLFVAGSTRPGEEAAIAALYQNLARAHTNLRVVVAPRHIERGDEVANIFASYGIAVCREKRNGNGAKVILIDRMGELNELYAAADLAFVGGTLAEIGGHNILEPVWCGTPVLFGPSLDNVSEAADYIIKNNYGGKVTNVDELTRVVGEIIDGKLVFDSRDDSHNRGSATAVVADYIMRRVGHA